MPTVDISPHLYSIPGYPTLIIGPLYTREAELLKKGAFPSVGSLLHILFTQVCFTLELFTWEFEPFIGLIMLRWCLDGSHVEGLRQSLGMLKIELSFCGPVGNGLLSILWLSWMLLCLVSSPPWYLTLSLATSQLLKLLRAWRLVQLPIVWYLDQSLSIPSIKAPKLQAQALNLSFCVDGP